MGKKILDVTCGSRTIWFNKTHPAAIYCDIRDEENGSLARVGAHVHRQAGRCLRFYKFAF